MAAGDLTPGRRVEPGEELYESVSGLEPGDYLLSEEGNVWVCLPADRGGGRCVAGDRWQITEHEDGTVTVSPSILDATDGGHGWHGYLERGVFREV